MRGQPISNRTRCSRVLYSGLHMRWLCVRVDIRVFRIFSMASFCRVICAICFWAHKTIGLFCRSTSNECDHVSLLPCVLKRASLAECVLRVRVMSMDCKFAAEAVKWHYAVRCSLRFSREWCDGRPGML